MGEDNRGSSGSSTAMIVIAILGGVLLVACCGGVVLVGGSLFVYRSARDMETEVMKAQESAEQARQEVESLKIPDAPPLVPPPEIAPAPDEQKD